MKLILVDGSIIYIPRTHLIEFKNGRATFYDHNNAFHSLSADLIRSIGPDFGAN